LEEAKPDNPPDGTETYEWKEGPNRIIDWRTGPGNEVTVEVLRNEDGPSEAERITAASTMPLSDEAISNLSEQVEESEVVHEDEDGWVSDQSLPEEAQAKVQSHGEKRAFTGRGSKKRRTDIHRPSIHHPRVSLPTQIDTSASTGSSTATATVPTAPSMTTSAAPESPLPKSPSSPSSIVDDEPRGRAPPASASSTFAARRRPRQHMRIVSLRGAGSEASSREVSPVRSIRSIRWADAGAGSAPATARWPQSQSAQGSRAPSPSPAESTENDTG